MRGYDNWKTHPPVVVCPNCSGEGSWDVFNFGGPEEWYVCDLCNGEGVLDEEEDE